MKLKIFWYGIFLPASLLRTSLACACPVLTLFCHTHTAYFLCDQPQKLIFKGYFSFLMNSSKSKMPLNFAELLWPWSSLANLFLFVQFTSLKERPGTIKRFVQLMNFSFGSLVRPLDSRLRIMLVLAPAAEPGATSRAALSHDPSS